MSSLSCLWKIIYTTQAGNLKIHMVIYTGERVQKVGSPSSFCLPFFSDLDELANYTVLPPQKSSHIFLQTAWTLSNFKKILSCYLKVHFFNTFEWIVLEYLILGSVLRAWDAKINLSLSPLPESGQGLWIWYKEGYYGRGNSRGVGGFWGLECNIHLDI